MEVIKEEARVNGDKPKGGQGKNYIQVGAFKTNAAAVSLSKKLSALLPEPVLAQVISPLQQSDLHKVWVGPLTEEKQKLYDKLMELSKTTKVRSKKISNKFSYQIFLH